MPLPLTWRTRPQAAPVTGSAYTRKMVSLHPGTAQKGTGKADGRASLAGPVEAAGQGSGQPPSLARGAGMPLMKFSASAEIGLIFGGHAERWR